MTEPPGGVETLFADTDRTRPMLNLRVSFGVCAGSLSSMSLASPVFAPLPFAPPDFELPDFELPDFPLPDFAVPTFEPEPFATEPFPPPALELAPLGVAAALAVPMVPAALPSLPALPGPPPTPAVETDAFETDAFDPIPAALPLPIPSPLLDALSFLSFLLPLLFFLIGRAATTSPASGLMTVGIAFFPGPGSVIVGPFAVADADLSPPPAPAAVDEEPGGGRKGLAGRKDAGVHATVDDVPAAPPPPVPPPPPVLLVLLAFVGLLGAFRFFDFFNGSASLFAGDDDRGLPDDDGRWDVVGVAAVAAAAAAAAAAAFFDGATEVSGSSFTRFLLFAAGPAFERFRELFDPLLD